MVWSSFIYIDLKKKKFYKSNLNPEEVKSSRTSEEKININFMYQDHVSGYKKKKSKS